MHYEIFTFRFRYNKVFLTTHADHKERRGLILRLAKNEKTFGFGEISPCPENSTESYSQASHQLRWVMKRLVGVTFEFPSELYQRLDSEFPELLPSVRFGIESAYLSLIAAENGSLAKLLNPLARESVELNGTLPLGPKGLETAFEAKVAEGSSLLTVEIRPQGLAKQLTALKRLAVKAESSGLSLRLDCNRSLARPLAEELLECSSELPCIEYVEEPLYKASATDLLSLRSQFPVRIGVDQSLEDPKTREEFFASACFDVAVLKPALLGGIRKTLLIAEEASRLGADIVFNSNFGTAVEVTTCLQLAAALAIEPLACGLNTLGFLLEDVSSTPPKIERGAMQLPLGNGLGLSTNLSQ